MTLKEFLRLKRRPRELLPRRQNGRSCYFSPQHCVLAITRNECRVAPITKVSRIAKGGGNGDLKREKREKERETKKGFGQSEIQSDEEEMLR